MFGLGIEPMRLTGRDAMRLSAVTVLFIINGFLGVVAYIG